MARDEERGDGRRVSDRRLAEEFARINLCGNQPVRRVLRRRRGRAGSVER